MMRARRDFPPIYTKRESRRSKHNLTRMSKSVTSICSSETSYEEFGPRSLETPRAQTAPPRLYTREAISSPLPGHLASKRLSHVVESVEVAALNYEPGSFDDKPFPPPNIYQSSFSFSLSSTANMSSHHSLPAISSTPSTSFSALALAAAAAPLPQIQLSPTTCPLTSVRILVRTLSGAVQEYTLHRALLCFHSPYFSDLLSRTELLKAVRRTMVKVPRPAWQRDDWWVRDEHGDVCCQSSHHGDQEKDKDQEMEFVINLPSTEIPAYELPFPISGAAHEIFAAFVNWLYNGPRSLLSLGSAEILVYLWLFAARVGVPRCQNEIIERLVEMRATGGDFPRSLLGVIEQETVGWEVMDRGLNRLFLDAVVWSTGVGGRGVNADVDVDTDGMVVWDALVQAAFVKRMREWLVSGGLLVWGPQCPLDMLQSRVQHYWVPPLVVQIGYGHVDVNTNVNMPMVDSNMRARRGSQGSQGCELKDVLLGVGVGVGVGGGGGGPL